MTEVNCPFVSKCSSYPYKCFECERNTAKRDYFKPRHPIISPDFPIPHNDPLRIMYRDRSRRGY